jgi:predicted nucleic acid-binding protein
LYLIFDTNILLYLRGPKSNFLTKKSRDILKSIKDGKHMGVIPVPTIMEITYLITESDNKIVANDFLKNLLSMNGVIPMDLTRDMGKFAGELYHKYNILPKRGLSKEDKLKLECPSACDCLLASVNKYLSNSIVCSNDRKIKKMSEIKVDFLKIKTN